MPSEVLYVDRATDTPADLFLTAGVAEVSSVFLQVLGRSTDPIWLRKQGSCYRIELPESLNEADIATLQVPFTVGPKPPLPRKTGSNRDPHQKGSDSTATLKQTQQAPTVVKPIRNQDAYLLSVELVEGDEGRAHSPLVSDSTLPLLRCLSHLRAAESYTRLWQQWHTEHLDHFRNMLRIFLELFSQSPQTTTQAIKRWAALARQQKVAGPTFANLLQIVNPAAGKGGNTPKANALNNDNLRGFWLLEYLKFVGFFTLAIPTQLKESKDRQLYILHPTNSELSRVRKVSQYLRASVQPQTAFALDVLTLLQLARIHVVHVQEELDTATPPLQGHNDTSQTNLPQAVSLLEVASYKNMGSAHALMHLATLHLPSWVCSLGTGTKADAVLSLLNEHLRIIGYLINTSYEAPAARQVLQHYRDFFSGQDLLSFFDFAASFGGYALTRSRHGHPLPLLSWAGMEYLMAQAAAGQHWSDIFENEGFEAVAGAIRRATVGAQYWATREPGCPYEIRYGLGKALLEAANNPADFLDVLVTFLQSYNAENARIDERIMKRPTSERPLYQRPSIRKEQAKDMIRLFDTFPPELISKMLVSYGYMRDGQVTEEKTALLALDNPAEQRKLTDEGMSTNQQEGGASYTPAPTRTALEDKEPIA